MGFPWHLSIICCPLASFHCCKYHFCCAHVGGADLFYNLNLNMIHSLPSALHFSSEKAKHRAVLFHNVRESGLVLSWGGSLFVDCPLLEKLQFGLKLHTGPHHRISQLILPYTMLRIDIFSRRAELFTVTLICLFLHRWRLPITLRLRCSAQMEMSNKLCLVVGLLHFTAQIYCFKSSVENKSTCQCIMLFFFIQQVDPWRKNLS